MSRLVSQLIQDGYLKSDLVIDAFSEISRVEFLPKDLEKEAGIDIALPIGYGQTISQPKTVAFMLELLEPEKSQKILDVGSGSGWTTALLSFIVGQKGKVIAIERIPELCRWGKENTDKFDYVKNKVAEFICADGKIGAEKFAPYDRILVSASGFSIPEELKKQLKIGGRMVIPVKNSIIYLEKKGDEEFEREEYPGFVFVPLV